MALKWRSSDPDKLPVQSEAHESQEPHRPGKKEAEQGQIVHFEQEEVEDSQCDLDVGPCTRGHFNRLREGKPHDRS
jgi:hypothetical protein